VKSPGENSAVNDPQPVPTLCGVPAHPPVPSPQSSKVDSRLTPPGLVVAAFAAVYLIWGSTYLAIRFTVETMPPFLSAAARFIISGAFLVFFRRLAGDAKPSSVQLRNAVGFKGPEGKMVLAALVDASGYSTAIQQKYQGLLITEVKLNIGGSTLPPGIEQRD